MVEIDPSLRAAVADVRSDSTPTDWVLAGFEGKTDIIVLGSGEGGIEELAKRVPQSDVAYGLVRKEHVLETAGTVSAKSAKFV